MPSITLSDTNPVQALMNQMTRGKTIGFQFWLHTYENCRVWSTGLLSDSTVWCTLCCIHVSIHICTFKTAYLYLVKMLTLRPSQVGYIPPFFPEKLTRSDVPTNRNKMVHVPCSPILYLFTLPLKILLSPLVCSLVPLSWTPLVPCSPCHSGKAHFRRITKYGKQMRADSGRFWVEIVESALPASKNINK